MKLILCAGDRHTEGFTHHDIRKLEGIDIVCDLHDILLHVVEGSCSEIQLTHALEHFPTKETPVILELLYKLLEPGGSLYIEVPNFAWHCHLLLNEYREEDAVYYAFGGQLDEFDFHKTGFTPQILGRALKNAKFQDIDIAGWDSLTAKCIK